MPLPPLPTEMGTVIEDVDALAKAKPVKDTKKKTVVAKKAPVQAASEKVEVKAQKPQKAVATKKPAASKKAVKTNPLPAPLLADKPKVKPASMRERYKGKKLFVLDTNVLMHDPLSLFQFEEHDVFLPMITLEELDGHKKGLSDVARNARQVSRYLDQLLAHTNGKIVDGIDLNALGHIEASGKLFFQTQPLNGLLPDALPQGKADNQILGVVKALVDQIKDRHVILVSKDINMRIKAVAMGLDAEDYFSDRTLDDTEMLYSGRMELPEDFWETHGKKMQSWKEDGQTWYKISGPLVREMFVNLFVYLPDDSFLAQVKKIEGSTATLVVARDYKQQKYAVWGITARNREQSIALNLLMNPEIDFVTLLGQAGTGKTLITLAAALAQTLDMRRFSEIIFTRATVSVGEEIGFLPGTEEEKMLPWMGALEDNLEVLNKLESGNEWSRNAANDLIRSRIKVKSMSFMRGRTFLNKLVIIDEAQNLSPKQMKTLITRAGPGSKIVCLGNIAQIDTPYLTEGSSGLTYVVDRFKGWEHSGHITLQRGERSRLADFASESL